NPEFLREGKAVDDFFNPDRIVIGTDNDEALQIMRELYADFNCPIVMTDIRSAEMIKYAANAFLATKISFINEIANLCEQVGADVEKVAYGMGLDKRIGSAFLGAGIGYGGSCFPKDVRALRQIAGNNGYDFKLLKAVIEVNKDQKELFWQKIQNHFSDFTGKRIAVLGLGFKAGTDDVRESIGLEYAQRLYAAGAVVIGYDRYAREKAQEVLPQIDYADNLEQIIDFLPDALVITTKDNEFRKIVPLLFQLNEVAIFDGRNLLVGENLQKVNIIYFSVGR
ncbi:UDP-glucose/GDP-mannose dehydrogenase family protein, partial [Candidatus Parcubacteria bacterium]